MSKNISQLCNRDMAGYSRKRTSSLRQIQFIETDIHFLLNCFFNLNPSRILSLSIAYFLRGRCELLHFREITQPLLPALTPEFNCRFIKVRPTISSSRERPNSNNNSASLNKSTIQIRKAGDMGGITKTSCIITKVLPHVPQKLCS